MNPKKILSIVLPALTAFAAFANPLSGTWFKMVTDKDPVSYKVGEPIVFTLTVENAKKEIPEGCYYFKWIRSGDDGVVEEGIIPVSVKPFVYTTKIDRPGFVRFYTMLLNSEKKELPARFNSYGAGAEIEKLQSLPEPGDFDAFWSRQRAKLDKVPVNANMVEVPSKDEKIRIYAVSIDCAGPQPATGYLTVPKAVDSGSKFPCRVKFHGYGVYAPYRAPKKGPENEIVFDLNAHGALLEPMGGDAEYAKKLRESVKSNGCDYGFDQKQNSNPETAYFNGMVLRVIRVLQYVKTLPGWNGKDLIASGGSQGGMQAIWAAGCGEGVSMVSSSVTWCCDLGGETIGRNRENWYVKWVPALGYFDPVNFAKRIPLSCRAEIPQAGLGDYTCPPSGLAILYNNIKGPKKITWVQGSDHGFIPRKYEGRDTVRSHGW